MFYLIFLDTINDVIFLSEEDLVDFKNNGETVAKFFFICDPDGYEIEVLERRGRFK